MKPRVPALLLILLVASCAPAPAPVAPAAGPAAAAPAAPSADDLAAARLTVPADRRLLQTLSANLDSDPAEEQILLLQNRANLGLPVTVQVAAFDKARNTYYLAWEGTALASASQPVQVSLEDLVGDHQPAILIRGLDEAGRVTLDVFRPSGVGRAYLNVFSKTSRGVILVERPVRPDTYTAGQNSTLSDTLIIDEPEATGQDVRRAVRTTYSWFFQKNEYQVTATERYVKEGNGDAALDKITNGDNAAFEGFLRGPWVKEGADKGGLLILFFDPVAREINFATAQSQEVYHWDVSSRSSRSSMYLVGSNNLIGLIRLALSVALTGTDSIEVNAQDDPVLNGTYKRLDASAALALARQGTRSLVQEKPPTGLYRDEKGNEFEFQVPEVRLVLGGVVMTGMVAVYPLDKVKVLQIKVAPRPGQPGLSKAYAMESKEESSTSRVVRTLRLQGGVLRSQGWVSDQSEPLRLEQVEGSAPR